MTEAGREVREVDLRAISGPVGEVNLRVNSGQFWVHSEVNLGPILDPILGNLIKHENCLHLAVGRALS